MANNNEELCEISKMNEKLYIDSYFRLLKADNSTCTKNYLREFLLQISFHCNYLNISESGQEGLKSELMTEYFNLMDSCDSTDLLPLVSNAEQNKNATKPTSDLLQEAANELDRYVKSLCLNKEQKESKDTSFQVASATLSKRQQQTNCIPHGEASTTRTASFHMAKQNINVLVSNPYRPACPTKRSADECASESKVLPKKFNSYGRNIQRNKTEPKSEKPKASVTGFMSASSMYRNPLKKAENAEEASDGKPATEGEDKDADLKNHESLKNFDKKIVEVILNEIMDFSPNIQWSDIAGLEFVKTTVQEIVIWPLLRPDIFTGLRAPPRGILLFGPPGTGKTLIGKCIATESNSTFFCISASSLASKWVGESEQLVRALFAVAHIHQPAVIFVDEIDSLLSQRSDKDQDFTRKLKTEFLVQFDGAKTSSEDRILVVGATNRPHELDEAARRRFVKRLYVPLPEESARRQIVQKLLGSHQQSLSEMDLQIICDKTKGYSGSDVSHLCKEAAMGPIRSIGPENIKTVSLDQVRPINVGDFLDALKQVRASVAQDDLDYYLEWNKKFGSFGT